ncbi:S8 family serine peptidase, partial [candidate division TA06 bacterium]|nr:S8 family serine peptidase [candidate division TA06 bacterium]
MKKIAVILLIAALAFTYAVAQTNDYTDEVLVKFLPGTIQIGAVNGAEKATLNDVKFSPSEIGQILQNNGVITVSLTFPNIKISDTLYTAEDGSKIKLFDLSNIYTIKLADKAKRNDLIAQLSKQPEVLYAEPNGIAVPYATPDDLHYPLQWGLNQTNDCDIDAPEAWDIYKGSSSIKIGIIDGGVENWHVDLSGKVSGDAGWGWSGHGFHTAGIAAAKTNNAIGVAGVDWNAQIISQRIDNTDDVGIYQAIMDAVNSGAHVLNNSWGLTDGSGNPRYSTTVRGAFANAYKINRVAVVSMGNDNNNVPHYPAAFGQGIIAVGATNEADVRATGWSGGQGSCYGNHIDVTAPGNNIISTVPYSTSYGYYDYMSGTSMSAPFVTGLASLLKGYNSSLSNDDIEQIIRISADDKGPAGWDQEYGTGRINARRALEMLGPNYCLNQWSASGGYQFSETGVMDYQFYGVSGLTDGTTYWAKRSEVRVSVSFPANFTAVPLMWGRGVGSNGFSSANANFGLPYCEVVPGTQTATGCQLRTYIYHVYVKPTGQEVGWFPYSNPASAVFQYTVLGPYLAPTSATISGYYDPNATAKGPIGYTFLNWGCTKGTYPVTYTLQVKEPY